MRPSGEAALFHVRSGTTGGFSDVFLKRTALAPCIGIHQTGIPERETV